MHADHEMQAAAREGEVLSEFAQFFAPSSTDMVDGLIAEYRRARHNVAAVAAFAAGEQCSGVLHYFLSGNATDQRGRTSLEVSAQQLFDEGGAVAALNSAYWSKALDLTDVYDAMPQDRRNQWNDQIRNPMGRKEDNRHTGEQKLPPLPDFEEETVRATLMDLLNSRARFLSERVDGIFRALSGAHVTNCPEGFGRRMIIAHLVSSYGSMNFDRIGYINDLRCVVAKFMGRGEPKWNATQSVVTHARTESRGQWVTLDGGALRLRAYKCGTAHLEVHPDMAWRLNCVLAHLYPLAIPAQFRQRPKRQPKDFVMRGRPLPFDVLEALSGLEQAFKVERNANPVGYRDEYRHTKIQNALKFRFGAATDKAVRAEAEKVIAYLGGVPSGDHYVFGYRPAEVLGEVITSGCLPDQKAHQFYPTPPAVAQAVIEAAQIGPNDVCLEPSAGTGALADLMPKERTTCVEISALHCSVLTAKGHQVIEADFLTVDSRPPFDRIVMNPPFSDGRAQLHTEHAFSLLKPGGRLVAVLPASMRGKDFLPGVTEWSRTYDNEFAGTSVSVAIMTVVKS